MAREITDIALRYDVRAMRISRPFRAAAALAAAATLLFAQLAVAGYACEGEAAAAAVAVAAPGEAHDCERMAMDGERSTLCHAHCQQGDESLDKPSVQVPECAATAVVATLWDPQAADAAACAPELASLLYRATAPPPAVRFCRFRN